MIKKHSKNTDLMVEALGNFIFDTTNEDVHTFEHNEKFKEIAVIFNKLPKLKRLLDFYIINYWEASVACKLYYEHDDFQKICTGVEDAIYKSLESYEKSNEILGFTLKDYVKDGEELSVFYREYPVGEETKVNFRVLLDILIIRRFFNYDSTLSCKDESQGLLRRSRYFCQHIFGKEESDSFDCVLILAPVFALMSSSTFAACTELIDKLENQS
ncbi:MAG: hypothetical protein AAB213_00830 [Candidatus Omnitrophota bacterium]